MSRAIIAIFGIILIGVVSVAALQAAVANAGDNRIVVNETWTPDAGTVTELDESKQNGAYYSNQTTVYDSTNVEMERGVDYEWYEDNGTVKALAGGGLDGESSATISFTYQQTTSEQRALAAIPSKIPNIIGVLTPLLGVALLFMFLKG